jgi:hypothetical protein
VNYLLREPYWDGTPDQLCEKVGLLNAVRSPIAVEPPLVFPRMAAQASTFTIHPIPLPGMSISDVLLNPRDLVRYIVPASFKQILTAGLRTLGVTERHLFPDLEGLSRTICSEGKIIGYGPPNPPRCSGEYENGGG